MDAGPPSRVTRFVRFALLAALEGASTGLAGWALRDSMLIPAYAHDNAVSARVRFFVFLNMGIGVAVAAVAAIAIAVWKRRAALDVLERLSRRLAPLSLAGLAVFLFDARLWAERAAVFLPLALVFGLGSATSVRTCLATPPAFPGLAARAARLWARAPSLPASVRRALDRVDLPLLAVVTGSIVYAFRLSAVTLANHRNFGTSAFDLGGFDNLMWNLIHGAAPFRSTPFMGHSGSHLARHATFFAYGVAPIYALRPGAEMLLVMQATGIGATAIPMHLTLRRRLPHATSAVVSLLFLAYAPLHGANLYDFHFLPMGGFFLWFMLLGIETRRTWLVVASAFVAIAVREDAAACVGVLGAMLLLLGEAPWTGLALAVAGGGYFLVMKLGVMPLFASGGETFINQYAGLLPPGDHSFGGILKTAVANPAFTANVMLERDKLVYVMQLFVPVLFLPWRRPIALLAFVPGVVFTLLGTGYWPLSEISFQYTAYWTPFVFLLLGRELEREGRARHAADDGGTLRRRAALAGVAAASLACSWIFGALVPHAGLRSGFDATRLEATAADLDRQGAMAALVPQLPARASVAASERLLPHVSARPDAFTLRFGILDAEYVLFEVPPRGDEKGALVDALHGGTFGVVDDRGSIVLARRGQAPSANAAVLGRL